VLAKGGFQRTEECVIWVSHDRSFLVDVLKWFAIGAQQRTQGFSMEVSAVYSTTKLKLATTECGAI